MVVRLQIQPLVVYCGSDSISYYASSGTSPGRSGACGAVEKAIFVLLPVIFYHFFKEVYRKSCNFNIRYFGCGYAALCSLRSLWLVSVWWVKSSETHHDDSVFKYRGRQLRISFIFWEQYQAREARDPFEKGPRPGGATATVLSLPA